MYVFFHLKCFIAIPFFKGNLGLLLMKLCTVLSSKELKNLHIFPPPSLLGTYA